MPCYHFARREGLTVPLAVSVPNIAVTLDDEHPVVSTSSEAHANLLRAAYDVVELDTTDECPDGDEVPIAQDTEPERQSSSAAEVADASRNAQSKGENQPEPPDHTESVPDEVPAEPEPALFGGDEH